MAFGFRLTQRTPFGSRPPNASPPSRAWAVVFRMMSRDLRCDRHGLSTATFVCRHLLDSLGDGVSRGFFYTSLHAEEEPCAWCSACDSMLEQGGGSWTAELEKKAEINVICYGCFLSLAKLDGVEP